MSPLVRLAPPPNWSTRKILRPGTRGASCARVSERERNTQLEHYEAHAADRAPARSSRPARPEQSGAGKGGATADATDLRRVARFLRELGIYPKDARTLAKRHTIEGVKRLLAEVEAMNGVRNTKAYLRRVLADRAPTRRAAKSEREPRPALRLVRGGDG